MESKRLVKISWICITLVLGIIIYFNIHPIPTRIAANEAAVSYRRTMLAAAVIIYEYDTAPEIDVTSDISISDICEMSRFGAVADRRILYFDKISDLAARTDTPVDRKSVVGKECRSRWSPYH